MHIIVDVAGTLVRMLSQGVFQRVIRQRMTNDEACFVSEMPEDKVGFCGIGVRQMIRKACFGQNQIFASLDFGVRGVKPLG